MKIREVRSRTMIVIALTQAFAHSAQVHSGTSPMRSPYTRSDRGPRSGVRARRQHHFRRSFVYLATLDGCGQPFPRLIRGKAVRPSPEASLILLADSWITSSITRGIS